MIVAYIIATSVLFIYRSSWETLSLIESTCIYIIDHQCTSKLRHNLFCNCSQSVFSTNLKPLSSRMCRAAKQSHISDWMEAKGGLFHFRTFLAQKMLIYLVHKSQDLLALSHPLLWRPFQVRAENTKHCDTTTSLRYEEQGRKQLTERTY